MDNQKGDSGMNQLLNKISNLVQTGNRDDALLQYADKLIEERKFPDLTPEVKEELRKDILRRLDDFLAARIIAALSDEDVLVFEKMLKEGKPETEVQKFVCEHVPDFVNFLTNTLLEFRGVYTGLIDTPVFVEMGETNKQSNLPPAPPAFVKTTAGMPVVPAPVKN